MTDIEECVAVIAAAGRSSRMNAFKPMLPLGGETVLRKGIISVKAAGIRNVVVVTGREHVLLEESLSDLNVATVFNENFAETQMLDSIKIGIKKCFELYPAFRRVLFMPGDIPLFRLSTAAAVAENKSEICIPVFHGRKGHPVAFSKDIAQKVLAFEGEGGLAGAFNDCGQISYVETYDEGMLKDADTPDQYHELLHFYDTVYSKISPDI